MRASSIRLPASGLLGLLLAGALAGCSLINAPDDVKDPGAGGAGTGGSGGGAPSCTKDDDCTSLTNECADGKCDLAASKCVADPKPAATPCGPAVGSTCDLADACDGAGQCTNNHIPDGTFCEDCAAGPGKCSLCTQGKCNDCTTRATEKSFRNPLALTGWTVTGSWDIHEETPPYAIYHPAVPSCADGVDNDGDGLIDLADLDCVDANDNSENKTACGDGVDNDGDGLIDLLDPDCVDSNDTSEYPGNCNDGYDNDGDGLIDFPDDLGCTSAQDDTEYVTTEIAFDHPVLGSDGNRVHPFNNQNGEREESAALSPPTVLPATLKFQSWNLDEGFSYDKKAVAVTVDGMSFTTLYACPTCYPNATGTNDPYCYANTDCCSGSCDLPNHACQPPASCTADGGSCSADTDCCGAACVGQICATVPAFCNAVSERDGDDWDAIELPVPATLVGQIGQVQFKYDTRDSCCDFERGWYVDALNFATDCACGAGGATCDYLDATCATGMCDATTKECRLTAKSAGAACTEDGTSDCGMASCDGNGFCNPNGHDEEGQQCTMCDDADGACRYCESGTCADCPAVQTFYYTDNTNDSFDSSFWSFTGDWVIGSSLAANSNGPAASFPYPSVLLNQILLPHFAPMLGNDGSRGPFMSPAMYGNEIESGTATTSVSTLPTTLKFNSWHQDRGGNDTFNLKDKKQILVSIDDGANFTVLVDCSGNTTYAFCQPWSPTNMNRALDQWDAISIPVPATFAGKPGKIRFSYDTVDSGSGWERGWYIDDLNVSRCD